MQAPLGCGIFSLRVNVVSLICSQFPFSIFFLHHLMYVFVFFKKILSYLNKSNISPWITEIYFEAKSLTLLTPIIGNRMIGSIAVTDIGMASVIHSTAIKRSPYPHLASCKIWHYYQISKPHVYRIILKQKIAKSHTKMKVYYIHFNKRRRTSYIKRQKCHDGLLNINTRTQDS